MFALYEDQAYDLSIDEQIWLMEFEEEYGDFWWEDWDWGEDECRV